VHSLTQTLKATKEVDTLGQGSPALLIIKESSGDSQSFIRLAAKNERFMFQIEPEPSPVMWRVGLQ
jgi:hypothetical protein